MSLENELPDIFEIDSLNRSRDTKLLVIPEAKNTILTLVIGNQMQSMIKIKRSDLDKVLQIIDGKGGLVASESAALVK